MTNLTLSFTPQSQELAIQHYKEYLRLADKQFHWCFGVALYEDELGLTEYYYSVDNSWWCKVIRLFWRGFGETILYTASPISKIRVEDVNKVFADCFLPNDDCSVQQKMIAIREELGDIRFC